MEEYCLSRLLDMPDYRYRPSAAGRGNDPNSIVRTYSEPVEWPVFGEQIDGYTVSTRPQADALFSPLRPLNRGIPLYRPFDRNN